MVKTNVACLAFLATLAAGEGRATTLSYTVNATLDGGGQLTGSFTVDQATLAGNHQGVGLDALALTVTAGTAYYGQVFGPGDQENGFNIFDEVPGGPVFGELEALSSEFDGGADLHLTFPYPSGGPVTTVAAFQGDDSYYTVSGNGTRYAISGSVTLAGAPVAVPEPATGLLLAAAGVLAVSARRRARGWPLPLAGSRRAA